MLPNFSLKNSFPLKKKNHVLVFALQYIYAPHHMYTVSLEVRRECQIPQDWRVTGGG